ncbi:MAG: TetR family transcriptional regulator [Novosphingobium sp.]
MKSKSTRRMGTASSETRNALIAAAAKIMNDEGIVALTARRLADEVGLKRQIVHYYFGTIDDLIAGVIASSSAQAADQFEKLLASQNPLDVLWRPSKHVAASSYEMMAAALRRPEVAKAIGLTICELRSIATDAVQRYFDERSIIPPVDPVVITSLLIAIGNAQAVESALGIDFGHQQVRDFVDSLLQPLLIAHDESE